jgi:hypothetical protein
MRGKPSELSARLPKGASTAQVTLLKLLCTDSDAGTGSELMLFGEPGCILLFQLPDSTCNLLTVEYDGAESDAQLEASVLSRGAKLPIANQKGT